IPRASNGRLVWSGDLTTPTSESAYILQAQGINIDGFEEASVDSRADMLREQLPDEIRKTLVQIREQYQPRLSGPQGAITLAAANHRLLDAYANARPVSRLTGAPIRPPENRPSDYEKVGLLVRLRRTLSTMSAEERIYLEGQANSRIANAADRTLSILPNLDGTPAQPLTGLPAWLTGDTWPTAEGDFEGLDGPKAVYAYVVLMNRFRTQASTVPQVQASIDALPALSDVRTNDDAAGQSMGMYRYLLDRQSILQDGMRIVSQDYSTACARAVELHIMQAQTNHALQGSNNLDAVLLAAGLAQFWIYGAARNFGRHGFLGGLYRSTIGTRGYILQPLTWAPRDIVVGAGRGGSAMWRRIFGGIEPHSGTGRALTASEAINLQRNIGRIRDIPGELAVLRGRHIDEVSRITKNLQSQVAALNPVTDAARIQQLQIEAVEQIRSAQQANAQVVRQLQAERTLLGRNVATSLDGVSDVTRVNWARTLMGGEDAIRALGRSAAEIQALERGILAAHNIGAGQRLTDLAVDASRNPIMHAGRQLNVRDAKWLRLRQAFEEAGIPWNASSRSMARHLMDGACGQGASGSARTLSTTAEVAQALSGQRALIQAAVRAGRMTAQEGQVLIALMRAGRLTEEQAKLLAAAARAGEIDHAAVAALRSATNWARAGRFISGLGRVASFAGAAFDSYVLVSETQALLEGRQRIQKAMQVLAKQLTDAHFEPVGAVDPQTGIAMRYRHESSGFTID
ncbi:MAG TPA: hypothetical protein PKV72_06450, partial [Candidatus Peribacteria bacterium]|nr:hypothetical protein [Candidatus Peribacteria bacterium]